MLKTNFISNDPLADHEDHARQGQYFRESVCQIMDHNWLNDYGYTMPSRESYPWMWLWDSCFHSIIYASLGDERALIEARTIFRWQTADGMVPHMGYQADTCVGRAAWGGTGSSVITQPPMYGHMLRVLHEHGFDVEPLLERAAQGIRFILHNRKLETGLINVVHPWETGIDDSPRWSRWCNGGTAGPQWRIEKDRFVSSLTLNRHGAAISNSLFSVAPASFNALVAFNAREIAELTDDSNLRNEADELVEALDRRFLVDKATWADTGPNGETTSSIRTLDALLPALVCSRADRVEVALRLTTDAAAFGAPHGPCGVDQREPSFDANAYWRGAAWPQLTYLFFVAALRSGHTYIAETLADNATRAAIRSNFSEYLNPITGRGQGAQYQSWACLPKAMITSRRVV